jgi:hypothetical protein
LTNLCVLHDPQGGDDDTADDDIFTEDFEDHPLGPLAARGGDVPGRRHTQTVVALKAGSGQVLLQQAAQPPTINRQHADLPRNDQDLRVDMELWLTRRRSSACAFINTTSHPVIITISADRYDDSEGLRAVDWSSSCYISCGPLTNENGTPSRNRRYRRRRI